MRYFVMIRRTPTGYSADVPDLPGCIAAARSLPAIRRLIAQAIGRHLELMRESGEKVIFPRQSIKFTIDASTAEEFCTWVEVPVPQPAGE